MNNEGKKTTTLGRILKGLLIIGLIAGTGVALYDHKEQIGNTCKRIGKKVFTKKNTNTDTNKPNVSNNSPRRNYNNNIRKN